MDKLGLSSVSEFQKTGGRGRRIQRKIYDKPDGFARRERGNSAQSQPQNLPKLFSSASAVAVYGNSSGEIILRFMLLEIIRFAVYTICVIIVFLLSDYLEIVIENGQEW